MVITENIEYAKQRLASLAKTHRNIIIDVNRIEISSVLNQIPIIDKKELVEYIDANIDHYLDNGILFSETSGSTGKPLITPRNINDLSWNINNQITAYRKYLQSGCDRVAIIHPTVLSPFIEASSMALADLGVGYVKIFPVPEVCDYKRMMDVIEKYKITAIMTTPTLAYKYLYETYKSGNITVNNRISKILLTGEKITKYSADNIRKILGREDVVVAPFVYGSSETATLMIGNDDFTYSSISDDFIYEIIDPSNNLHANSTSRGSKRISSGKLVVTWLREGLMPIVRYDTGDMFEYVEDNGLKYWNFLNRSIGLQEHFEQELDIIIYDSGIKVFNYQCNHAEESLNIKILGVPDDDTIDVVETIKQKVEDIDRYNMRVSVDIIQDCPIFSKFSISPKLKKHIYLGK